jgi:hypothetical protein
MVPDQLERLLVRGVDAGRDDRGVRAVAVGQALHLVFDLVASRVSKLKSV